MRTSQAGVDLIKHFESLRLVAYQCSAGVWTIGWGHTKGVKAGDRITEQEAERLFELDLLGFERDVDLLTLREPDQGQFDAMVSFAFNVGSDIDLDKIAEGLGDSTLLTYFNAGSIQAAADEFPKWNKSKGKVTPGLVRRRAAERALFLRQDWRAAAA